MPAVVDDLDHQLVTRVDGERHRSRRPCLTVLFTASRTTACVRPDVRGRQGVDGAGGQTHRECLAGLPQMMGT